MATLEKLFQHAPPDMPIGFLREALQALGTTAAVSDVLIEAGRRRLARQRGGELIEDDHRTAPTRERRVTSPSARQHAKVLAVALDPTIRYVRRKVFGEETAPFRSANSAVAWMESNPELRKKLEPMVERIATATGFDLAESWRWVLVGREPQSPVTVTLAPRISTLPDGRWIDSTRVRIESAVPLTGDAEIRAATRRARELWGTERMKAWSKADVRLLQKIAEAGGPPTGVGMLRRWEEIAEKANLPSGPAAIQRWKRVEDKAERLGVPLYLTNPNGWFGRWKQWMKRWVMQ